MRVIVDIRPLLERHRSGVGTYAAEITKALAPHGTFGCTLFANGTSAEIPGDMPKAVGGTRRVLTRIPNRALNAAFRILGRPLVETLAGSADVAYLPNLNFVATKLPLVVTVHDLSFVRRPRLFSAKQRLWHAMVAPETLIRRANAVVCVSEHTKRDVMELYGTDAGRITVASPGVHAAFCPRDSRTVRAFLRERGMTRPYFLFLGNIEPRKNIAGLIEAFERVDADADLVIAGGLGWLYEDILRRADRSPKKARIRFLGYVRDDEKPLLYSGALALVYPSFYEGFGMPPLEAMACGTPVIASHASSLGEVVGDAGLLVEPRDPEGIAHAMRTVLADARLTETLRARGMARAAAFRWDASAAAIARVFASVVR